MTSARSITVAGLTALVIAGSVTAANAQRPDTRAYHCQAIHASLAQYKTMVMSFSNTQYRRFVEGPGFCGPSQVIKQMYVPALDTPRCPMKVCEEKIFDVK